MDDFLLKGHNLDHKDILIAGITKSNTLDVLISFTSPPFNKLTVIDINENMILQYKEKYKERDDIEFLLVDLCDVSFLHDQSFDIIVLPSTLSSINERPLKSLQAIHEVKRILKKNGILLIREKISTSGNSRDEFKFYNWFKSRYLMLENLFNFGYITYKKHFYLNDLRFALKISGFSVDAETSIESEEIGKEDKIELYKKLENVFIQKNETDHPVLEHINREFNSLKNDKSLFPPHIIIKCSQKE